MSPAGLSSALSPIDRSIDRVWLAPRRERGSRRPPPLPLCSFLRVWGGGQKEAKGFACWKGGGAGTGGTAPILQLLGWDSKLLSPGQVGGFFLSCLWAWGFPCDRAKNQSDFGWIPIWCIIYLASTASQWCRTGGLPGVRGRDIVAPSGSSICA